MNRRSGFSRSTATGGHPERSEGPLSLAVRFLVPKIVHRRLCYTNAFAGFLAPLGMTALVLCSSAGLLFAQDPSATSISREVKECFQRCAKAVVKIHGVDEHSDIYGTGFFVDPTGTLFTSYTVGGEADSFTVQFGGKEYPARQLVVDTRSGIALLKIDLVTPA